MEVGVCRIVFGDLRSRLGKFINLEPGVKNPKSRSENVKLEEHEPELETFLQEAACIPVPYSKSKFLYFDGIGIFIRRDFRGILEVSCVLLLRQILDFSTRL